MEYYSAIYGKILQIKAVTWLNLTDMVLKDWVEVYSDAEESIVHFFYEVVIEIRKIVASGKRFWMSRAGEIFIGVVITGVYMFVKIHDLRT